MLVNPGFFRTDLLTPESTTFAESAIDDYRARTEQTVTAWRDVNGQQGGNPAKLATALITLAGIGEPPLRWAAGTDAIGALEDKAQALLKQADAYRELSSSLSHNDNAERRFGSTRDLAKPLAQRPVTHIGDTSCTTPFVISSALQQ